MHLPISWSRPQEQILSFDRWSKLVPGPKLCISMVTSVSHGVHTIPIFAPASAASWAYARDSCRHWPPIPAIMIQSWKPALSRACLVAARIDFRSSLVRHTASPVDLTKVSTVVHDFLLRRIPLQNKSFNSSFGEVEIVFYTLWKINRFCCVILEEGQRRYIYAWRKSYWSHDEKVTLVVNSPKPSLIVWKHKRKPKSSTFTCAGWIREKWGWENQLLSRPF